MVRSSLFSDEQYDIYECYVESGHEVTSGEEDNGYIDIAGVEPHAVVIANKEYARAYRDGALATVTSVTLQGGTDARITITGITEGEIVDIYFPVTGTGCGSLISNVNTGKLAQVRMQNMQSYGVESNLAKVPECGTERKETIEFASAGIIVLGLNRYGNTAMADFTLAQQKKSNGDERYLLIDVIDKTVSPATHDLLLEAKVIDYEDVAEADDSIRGIVTDIITFKFVPDVVTL